MSHLTFVSEDVIKRHLSMPQVIDLMEYVFANPELGNMPPKTYVEFDGNDFRAMPAVFEDSAGIKWASIFPKNEPSGRGPNISATIMLNDIKTGYPLAIMDGMLITSYRTAAVTGLATKYLSRTNSDTAAFIGCGFQTRFQIEAILNVRDIKHIKLFDLDEDKAIELCRHLMAAPYADKIRSCEVCDSVKECVRGSDILTTLTPSRDQFIMADWIEPGMHINAIGADAKGKQEFEDNISRVCSKFVVDDKVQAFHSGESQHSDNKAMMVDLFHVVKGGFEHPTEGGITFFDSTGLAVEDVALASYIYRKHNERKE